MNPDLKARLGGLALLAGGAGMAYYFIFRVLAEAKAGVAEVSYSMKGAALGPILVLGGISMLAMGSKVEAMTQRIDASGKKSMTPVGYAVTAIAVAVGIGTYFWFKSQLDALGYQN